MRWNFNQSITIALLCIIVNQAMSGADRLDKYCSIHTLFEEERSEQSKLIKSDILEEITNTMVV